MILHDQLREIPLQNLTLMLRHAINPPLLNLMARREQRAPSRHGIRAHHRMRGLEVNALVLRCAAIRLDEFFTELFGDADEVGLVVRCGETGREVLEFRRQTIVELVAGRPQGVAAGVGGGLDDLQDGVVGRDVLESDAVAK
jgi:hypothetical protein